MAVMMVSSQRMLQHWKNGFCSCTDDTETCMMSWCAPCVQYGRNVEQYDGSPFFGNCLMYAVFMSVGCACLVHSRKRTSMRISYGLYESCCSDCCVTMCCACCALAQEARELKSRGPPPVMTMGSPVVMATGPSVFVQPAPVMYAYQQPQVAYAAQPIHAAQPMQQQQQYQPQQQYQQQPQQQYQPQQQQYSDQREGPSQYQGPPQYTQTPVQASTYTPEYQMPTKTLL